MSEIIQYLHTLDKVQLGLLCALGLTLAFYIWNKVLGDKPQ